MLVVSMHAGPGTGKSTTAAQLFALLKHRGHKVELVTEFAKDLCYEQNPLIQDQLYILAEMNRRFYRLQGQVNIAVTDCPLTLGLVYGKGIYAEPWFRDTTLRLRANYDNFDVFLQRVKPYQRYGRYSTEDEARALDTLIHASLPAFDIQLPADENAARTLVPHIEQRLNELAA